MYVLRCRLMARQMMWRSQSIPPSVVPPSALYYATPIAGPPFDATMLPQDNNFPHTDVYREEPGRVPAAAGSKATKQEEVCTGDCLGWTDTPCDLLLKIMDVDLGMLRAIGFCFGEGLGIEPNQGAPMRLDFSPCRAEGWFCIYRCVFPPYPTLRETEGV